MNNSATRSRPTMALFNNGFKPNYRHTIFNTNNIVLRTLKLEIEYWALSNKIRMKMRMGDPDYSSSIYSADKVVVYFEDDMDLAAFKLKFNV